ncbi:MAG: hypothetical protein H7223_05460, partial [Pedobacter sp.]|nr:hypothetical protein [Pedobacter sp.]
MKKTNIPLLCLFLVMVALGACKKNSSKDTVPGAGGSEVPSSFSYVTTKDLSVSVRLLTNNDKPIVGALVNITDSKNADRVFLKAVSDANGYVRASIKVPSYLDTLVISPNYVGLLNNIKSYIGSKSSISAIIGGQFAASGDILPEVIIPRVSPPGIILSTIAAGNSVLSTYSYPTGFSSSSDAVVNSSNYPSTLGRPKYLEAVPDVIETSLLNYVNASLPEGKVVTDTHPDYLATNAANNIVLTENSDVYVTFVSEGTSFYNTLAYYSYDTDDPPLNASLGGLLG